MVKDWIPSLDATLLALVVMAAITVSLAPYLGVLEHVIAPDVERRKRAGLSR